MTRCLQKHYSVSFTSTCVNVLSQFTITHTQGVVLEEHSVECVTSGEKRLLPPAMISSGVVRLMSFTAFSAASVKSKVKFLFLEISMIFEIYCYPLEG